MTESRARRGAGAEMGGFKTSSSPTSSPLYSLTPATGLKQRSLNSSDHVFLPDSLLRVAALRECHSYAWRSTVGRPHADTNGSHGIRGHVTTPNRSAGFEWHTSRASQETEFPIPATGELVWICRWSLL